MEGALTDPPSWLQWIIRRMHNGLNRWTQRRLAGEADRRYGWSAWSYAAARQGSRIGRIQMAIIDAIFWRGHCEQEWRRVREGRDLVIGWRTVGAVVRLLALAAILVAAIFFLIG
jgi:hypothetical protein